MDYDDDEEISFKPNKYGNPYDDAVLPALRSVPPENETEDDRIKREIWEDVERTKNSRLAREEAERKRRAARKKGATNAGPVIVADDEASEKLLAQRKKREEERKKLLSLRQQSTTKKIEEDDVVVSSPKKDTIESKKLTPSFDFAPPKADPKPVEVSKPPPAQPKIEQPKPVPKIETKIEQPIKTEPKPVARPSISTSVAPSSDRSNEDSKWKSMYDDLKGQFMKEEESKRNLQRRLDESERLLHLSRTCFFLLYLFTSYFQLISYFIFLVHF